MLKVNSVVAPEARCNWNPNKVKYGGKAALSFAFDSESIGIAQEEGCALEKISYGTKAFKPDTLYTISSSVFSGLSHSKDTSIVVKAAVTCGEQDKWGYELDCGELEIDSVPGPKWTGTLSFKKSDYVINDTSYFFIGTRVDTSFIENAIQITNKDSAECGNIIIKIDGSPARLNTPVKATAVVYCRYTDTLELASISAKVLPDHVIGDCELSGNSKATMRSDETLTVSISVDNSYGRCDKIEYTFSSSSGNSGYGESNSFALANSGNKTLNGIYARVTCGGTPQTPKKCPTVTVASYIKWDECRESKRDDRGQLTFKSGKTIVDFACDTDKEDYYISCQGDRGNFAIEIDGYKEGDSDSNIRPNGGDNGYNFPNLKANRDGSLYRYPISITVNNKGSGDLKCGIW
jgi:hypothetical protein